MHAPTLLPIRASLIAPDLQAAQGATRAWHLPVLRLETAPHNARTLSQKVPHLLQLQVLMSKLVSRKAHLSEDLVSGLPGQTQASTQFRQMHSDDLYVAEEEGSCCAHVHD